MKRRKPAKAGDDDSIRQRRFEELYLNGGEYGGAAFRPGNAYRSAIAAGYSPKTARSNCHILAARVNVPVADAIRRQGITSHYIARRLVRLTQARLVKWNPESEQWDDFEDGHLQLEALKESARLLDAYPAPKESNDIRPVQIVFPANFASVAVTAEPAKEA